MRKYKSVDVSETQLEDLVRQAPDNLEEGLRYIDHQRRTSENGRLDVLMVDSANSLVIAELKIVEEDTMLTQGIDYYDDLDKTIEGIARIYKDFKIDPKQGIRLFLIAPSFSITLLNRCKHIDIDISLFTYRCIQLDDSKEIIPIFTAVNLPSQPKVIEEKKHIPDILAYITDQKTRERAQKLLDEIQSWDKGIFLEPIKYSISMKFNNRVFAYLDPRRKNFNISTYDNEIGRAHV